LTNRTGLFLLIVLALGGLSGWIAATRQPAYGLDVQGGSRFVFRLDTRELPAEQRSNLAGIQRDMVNILRGRAQGALAVQEPTVYAKGTDQVAIELPGYSDASEAYKVISTTAKIRVYWAKNVSTESRQRRYITAEDIVDEDGVTVQGFARRADPTKTLKPGDPEYREMLDGWEIILEGSDVANAQPLIDGNRTQPQFFFNEAGSRKLEAWSRRYMNQGEQIAFVLDGRVLSIAPVKDGTILKESAFIDGDFEPRYVQQLTNLVKAGSLPVPLIEESREQVDPTIGRFALRQMVTAGLISFAIIILYLVFYYAFAGVLATLAMVLYGLITYALLVLIGATFSLAAIAAFILSTGMAIDANVLVFERLKEEIRNGKTVAQAVPISFKRALSAIIDSNVATMFTCVLLIAYGTGPVQGFGTTLGMGVAVSFFTAFIVTRALMELCLKLNIGASPKAYALNRNWFGERLEQSATSKPLNIVGRTKLWFAISVALIVPGIAAIAMGGIRLNVEFQGGSEGTYLVPANVTGDQVRENLEAKGYRGFNLKFSQTDKGRLVYITVPPRQGLTQESLAADAGLSAEGSSFTQIGPAIQKETVNNAIILVTVSSLLIMAYLAFRFGIAVGGFANGIKFGLSAGAALVHDVIFVVGLGGIVGMVLGWEVSALLITAILTVIGFSVHDTIVIFDRIRENLRKPNKGETFEHLCDLSVTQSVARSLNTSFTAVLSLVVLIFWGTTTPDLKFMCLAMLAGIAIGTYSSIFNATPILYLWDKAVRKSKGESAGLLAEAQRDQKLRAQQAVMAGASAGADGTVAPAGYGQVKRRSSAVDQSKTVVDDD
jgi:SecD/SecF fusion protein